MGLRRQPVPIRSDSNPIRLYDVRCSIFILFDYLIAAAHSAGPGHGLRVADDMLQDWGYGLVGADDLLQDDRNMLRQEAPTPGGEHLGQCRGNLWAIFG